jgi:hypothetical protein
MIWCPVLETGRNSVSPSTRPSTRAWTAVQMSTIDHSAVCQIAGKDAFTVCLRPGPEGLPQGRLSA